MTSDDPHAEDPLADDTSRATPQRGAGGNLLLQVLPDDERTWVEEQAERVTLRLREVLVDPGETPEFLYFPENSVVSMVNPIDDAAVEVGVIGYEGVVGLSLFLDAKAPPTRMLVQVAGTAWRLPADVFRDGIAELPALQHALRRYTHALLVQVAQNAACNRMHTIDRRCARWLLTTHDRVFSDTFEVTQEFLAYMLGVRRAGVSEAAEALRDRGLIRYTRGRVTVVDRAGLEAAACDCYGIIRTHLAQTTGVGAA